MEGSPRSSILLDTRIDAHLLLPLHHPDDTTQLVGQSSHLEGASSFIHRIVKSSTAGSSLSGSRSPCAIRHGQDLGLVIVVFERDGVMTTLVLRCRLHCNSKAGSVGSSALSVGGGGQLPMDKHQVLGIGQTSLFRGGKLTPQR
jgi:hypothetical protein